MNQEKSKETETEPDKEDKNNEHTRANERKHRRTQNTMIQRICQNANLKGKGYEGICFIGKIIGIEVG